MEASKNEAMNVIKNVTQELVIDWDFTGDIDEEEARKIVAEDTQALEESGYSMTFEDEVYVQYEGQESLEISQIWSKELNDD